MKRSFKFRLYPNANQERELSIALETHRRLYDECLSLREMVYSCYAETFTYADCSAHFKLLRTKNPYFQRLNYSSAQATMRKLDKSYANFFRRCKEGAAKKGYPKFKAFHHFDSFTYATHGDGCRLTDNRLRLQYVGVVKVKLHRAVEGKIKTVTIKREADKWYVIFACELPDVAIPVSSLPEVGLDVGLKEFFTLSTGEAEPNPRFQKKDLPKLRIEGRSVSRKKLRGRNRRKAVNRLRKVHTRIKNCRAEHRHRVSRKLTRRFGVIAVERLNIRGMLKNHRLARSISDAAWGGFIDTLKHHAQKSGAKVVEVDPKGTSQQCSGCGQNVPKCLSDRWHDCPYCGLSLDRDHNASLNILARGQARMEPAGVNVDQQVKRLPRSHRL